LGVQQAPDTVHCEPSGHGAHKSEPPQPSSAPQSPGATSAQVFGVQHFPSVQVAPLRQSPQKMLVPSHPWTEPQKSPSHVGGRQGTQSPAWQVFDPSQPPQATTSPH
jgi:hypothetical protein